MDPDLTIRIRIPDWRERLTKVERLLAEAIDPGQWQECNYETGETEWVAQFMVEDALAEIRSILNGA